MANLAEILKEEIRRLARKEVKAETGSTRQAVVQYRRDIARLKRQVQEQEKTIAFLKSQERKRIGQPEAVEESSDNTRFSARSVRSQRRRLGMSAALYAKLIGVSSITIYNWEHGKTRPQQSQMATLVAVRGIGKREALAKLGLLEAVEAKKRGRRKPR